jgi:hypothetical protein
MRGQKSRPTVIRAAFLVGFISCYVEDLALIFVSAWLSDAGSGNSGLQLRARSSRKWDRYLDRDVAQIAIDSYDYLSAEVSQNCLDMVIDIILTVALCEELGGDRVVFGRIESYRCLGLELACHCGM